MPVLFPYPVFLHLQGRPVLIVGGGSVGLRKARGLAGTGAAICVVAPEMATEFTDVPGISLRQEAYSSAIMNATPRWTIAFAATDSPAVNALVQQDAAARGILCCRCDEPEAGDFSGGAMWQSGGVSLAVSTAGASPVLAARLRDQAAGAVDPLLAALAELLAIWRPRVLGAGADEATRRQLLRRIASPEMEAHLRAHGATAADQLFERWLADISR